MADAATTTTPRRKTPADESIKETLESVVMAFVLAFVFRAYVVEAFVIPTGSMAPTLLGQHIDVTCTECGYRYSFDVRDSDRAANGRSNLSYITASDGIDAICPMCRHVTFIEHGTRISAGDRILVHKYIYSISEPRRWDVVVFKNPSEPEINFIKRLVGLPDEDLWIIEGNVYVRPRDAQGSPSDGWHIARKTDRTNVQQAVWQPIYHSRFIPRPNGERFSEWSCPWRVIDGEAWQVDHRRSYHHDASTGGTIEFDFERHFAQGPGLYPYNQSHPDPTIDPIEDIRLAARIEAQGEGLSVDMSTTARLDDPDAEPQVLIGSVDADGNATLVAVDPATKQQRELARGQVAPLAPGRTRQMELWFVDQHAMLWVDDAVAAQWSFELSIDAIAQRSMSQTVPRVGIAVRGAPVALHNVELDRDLFYTSTQAGGVNGNSQGTLVKRRSMLDRDATLAFRDGQLTVADTGFEVWLDATDHRQLPLGRAPEDHPRAGQLVTLPDYEPVTMMSGMLQIRPDGMPVTLYRGQLVDAKSLRPINSNFGWRRDLFTMRSGRPVRIGPDRFFCLGDNSPRSNDSRYWDTVNPWIRRRMLSEQGEEHLGVVPRKLMMGRAFFVYLPAMYSWDRKTYGVIPNFGDMRFIH